MRDQTLRVLASEGILLEPEAAELVLKSDDPLNLARSVLASLPQRPLFISAAHVAAYKPKPAFAAPAVPEALTELRMSHTVPTRISCSDIKVLRDVTGNSTCDGNIMDFARCFVDRYRKIRKILSRRMELKNAVPVPKASKSSDREISIIGIVNEVKTTKNGHKILEVEDEEGKCPVLIMNTNPSIDDSIVTDEVIGIVGKASKSKGGSFGRRDKGGSDREGGLIVMNEGGLIRPDVPVRSGGMEPSDSSASIAFMSDVHVGSNTFLKSQWDNMMRWLKTEGKDRIQYLVVPGDVVDGIGVFPGQEQELEIDDIFLQYEALANLLKDVPDSIRLMVQPGNHDAVRPAEPQPTFPKELVEMFDSSTMFVGNPCWFEVEGRKILSYHGRSLDDWVGAVQGLSYENPLAGMKEMLKRRHIAPLYGGRTPMAPEKEDYMVIDEVPDIFVSGHVHGAGLDMYHGVRLICASTWQDQTPFQKMHNFSPDPGKLPVVHLGTGKAEMLDFNY